MHRAGDATGEGRLLRTKEKERRGEERTTQGVWGIREFHDWIDRSIGRTDPTNSSDSVASPED